MIAKIAVRNSETQSELMRLYQQVWDDHHVTDDEECLMERIGLLILQGVKDSREVAQTHMATARMMTVGVSAFLDDREERELIGFMVTQTEITLEIQEAIKCPSEIAAQDGRLRPTKQRNGLA